MLFLLQTRDKHCGSTYSRFGFLTIKKHNIITIEEKKIHYTDPGLLAETLARQYSRGHKGRAYALYRLCRSNLGLDSSMIVIPFCPIVALMLML